MTFNSEEYWGLDEEIVGDGTSDNTTRSMSEAVERRLEANSQFLKSRDWKICYACANKNEDNKTTDADGLITNSRRLGCLFSIWGKAIRQTDQMGQFLFTVPVFINPDTTKFRATMKGYVMCPRELKAGNKPDGQTITEPDNELGKSVRVQAFLAGGWKPPPPVRGTEGGGSFFGSAKANWFTSDNPVHRIEVEVDKNVETPMRATLLLEFHTNPQKQSESVGVESISDADLSGGMEKWNEHILNYSNTNNALANIETLQKAITDDTFVSVTDFDGTSPVYAPTRTSLDDHKIHVALRQSSATNAYYVGDSTQPTTTVHYYNSIVPQSWTFESFSDKTTPARRYNPKTNGEMKANQVISGEDISDHAQNIDYNYRKPRLKSMGPEGASGFITNNEVPWSQGYADTTNTRWGGTLFSDKSTSYTEAAQIDRHTFRADKGAATYRVVTHYVPVSFWKVSGLVEKKTQTSDNVDGHYAMSVGSTPDIEDLTIEAGVDIDFSYEIRQRGSSATNEIVGSATVTESNNPIFIANIRNRFPLLRTIYEFYWTDPDGQDFTYSGDEINSNPNLNYREGWLDRYDVASLIQTAEHEVELPGPTDATVDHERPFEMLQYLSGTSNVTASFTDRAGNTTNHPDNRIILVTLQTAVFEEPG